ncbi:MAG: nucleoside hydrolase [Myxococcota bacterium]
MRIWLDTDLGSDVDDALALAYGLRHPGIELVGISTVFGDVKLRTRCVEALLEIAKAGPIPVLTGLGKPLTERRAGVMFGHEGKGLLSDPVPQLRVEAEAEKETEARIDTLASAMTDAAPDFVVAIGPLTNLAALVHAGAQLPPLAMMGGKASDVQLPGMTDRIGEWNFFSDPEAARAVLGAVEARPARIVPVEVTFRTALEPEDLEALASGDALCRTLHLLCGHWLDLLHSEFGTDNPTVALHDPLTLATLMEPDLCPFELRRVEIDDKGNARAISGDPNAEIALDVDLPALRKHLLEVWLGTFQA